MILVCWQTHTFYIVYYEWQTKKCTISTHTHSRHAFARWFGIVYAPFSVCHCTRLCFVICKQKCMRVEMTEKKNRAGSDECENKGKERERKGGDNGEYSFGHITGL